MRATLVPLKKTITEAQTPKVAHLGVLTPLNPPWVAIKPGNWMMYSDGVTAPTPMLLVEVKPGKMGVAMEFACCNNPQCTKRIKFEAKWNGRHFEQGKDEEVKPG